jgi:hypothetical protein
MYQKYKLFLGICYVLLIIGALLYIVRFDSFGSQQITGAVVKEPTLSVRPLPPGFYMGGVLFIFVSLMIGLIIKRYDKYNDEKKDQTDYFEK